MSVEQRTLPHAPEAERALLGVILRDPRTMDLVSSSISSGDFFVRANRDIYSAAKALHEETGSVDRACLAETLGDKLEGAGGAQYLFGLHAGVSPGNLEMYVKTVSGKARLRRMLAALRDGVEEIYECNSAYSEDVIERVSVKTFDALADVQRERTGTRVAHDIVTDLLRRSERVESGETVQIGVPSGFSDLDDLIGGLCPGKLIILAGRPSMGKTTMLLNILRKVCVVQGEPALFFSMESNAEEAVGNMIAAHARVNNRMTRDMIMGAEARSRMTAAAGYVADAPLYINDSTDISVHDVRAEARIRNAASPIKLVALDYLQLLRSPSTRKYERRDIEVGEMTARLKGLAKELDVPVIALAQLNRAVESREGHIPRLSDLRESGSIEQDADVVVFMHRPGYYSLRDEDKRSPDARAIVAKNRDGRTGQMRLHFKLEMSLFEQAMWEKE